MNNKIGIHQRQEPKRGVLSTQHMSNKLSYFGWAILLLMSLLLMTVAHPYFAHNSAASSQPQPTSHPNTKVIESFWNLPLTFEENKGQFTPDVKFASRAGGLRVYLTDGGTILSPSTAKNLSTDSNPKCLESGKEGFSNHRITPKKIDSANSVTIKLVGARALTPAGANDMSGTVNYFIGADPKKWLTDIRSFGKISYNGIYPGIDQLFYGTQGQLEYDFIVSPGTNPAAIRMTFKGVKKLNLRNGRLVLRLRDREEIFFNRPLAYQEADGVKREVSARYNIKSNGEVGFAIGAYDRSKRLIIDPVVSYSSYLGGSGNDAGFDIAVDGQGSTYLTGSTDSAEFSSAEGSSNAFVAKLNAAGTQRVYLAIIGGTGNDAGFSLAVDSAGNAYVTGTTDSPDFPATNSTQSNFGGGSQDAFVAKLNSSGSSVTYATYFGGTGNDTGFGIALDSGGSAYVTGSSDSTEFSTLGNTNAYVMKLNALGTERSYLAILGGAGDDTAFDIAVDGTGSASIVGSTDSANFTTANPWQPNFGGLQDAFIAKLNVAGSSLVYSSYLGGTGNDSGFGIAVDGAGSSYVTGSTDSSDFTSLGGRDVFVAKFNASGSDRTYFTILGGNGDDAGFAIAVDPFGNAHVTGSTDSGNFTLSNPFQPLSGGSQEVFVAKLDPAGSSLAYSSYIGGLGNESGFAVAVDTAGNTYVTGFTSSNPFPTTSPHQPASGGNGDAFALKISTSNAPATFQLNSANLQQNESAGNVTTTVNRVGDASQAATIFYATTDTAGLANCTLVEGKASERCDYQTTVGTLRFAPGENTKTFTIPIINDALVEGSETLVVNLSSPVGAALGFPSTATVTILDNDTDPVAKNPFDDTEFFITMQYIDFLGRLPDPDGLAAWNATLNGCPNGGFGSENPSCDRVHVSSGFFLSDEFRGRGYWAYRFYEVAFNRRPSYAQFVPDMAQVGGPQSPQSEELSKSAYKDEFVQRSEFTTQYNALPNAAFVNAIEANAEVNLDDAGLTAQLDAGKTRAQLLREIVESKAVEDQFFIRAFVAMQYFGYLRRDPDTVGYNNWVTTLTSNPSDFRHMIFGFIYSTEYRQRFGTQ